MNFARSISDNDAAIPPTGARRESLPRQVVTLAFLAGQINNSLLSEQLARSLCAETEASVVIVRLVPEDGKERMENGARPELVLNGEVHLPPQVPRTDAGFHSLTLGIRSDPPTPASIASLLSQLSRRFRHVLIQMQIVDRPEPWFYELLIRSDLAYLFLKPATKDVYLLDQVMQGARAQCRDGGIHVKPVVCLADGEQIDGFDSLIQHAAGPVHMFVHGCPGLDAAKEAGPQTISTGSFHADLRRLAREIGGCLVGLALSSGAAKGFAHVGVIQVLEENGIEVDVVSGSSMGAYVGSLWAHGCDGCELERLSRELESPRAILSMIDPAFPSRRGFIHGFAVKKRLMRSIGYARFADLQRPLRVVAANLATLERVVFSGGEVATAVHASVAVPGICVPVTIDGETYTDGGIVDPLPVDVLREMGVTRIIAVNVNPTPERIRHGIEAELELARHERTIGRKLFRKGLPPNAQASYFARGSLLEVLLRSVHSGQIRMAEASCLKADLVLRPDIYDDRWLDFRHPRKFIALGRESAERHLEEIKALVNRKDVGREPELAPEPLATIV
jgi:NTE family protein